ncbi:hyalin-like [Asterias rubens]|uniref:hyalin-like n=1 Tax=Asterias rubens TaxID=7604 RepID=UPI001455B7C4|nr:hyalin-like [Asterias rubens]
MGHPNIIIGTLLLVFMLRNCHGIADTESPMVMLCSSDVSFTLAVGASDSLVAWVAPIITDDSGNFTLTKSHGDPPQTFPAGPTVVTYFAVDDAGNNATCDITVLVVDKELPVFDSCPGSQTNTTAPSDNSVTLSFEVTATDNVNATVAISADAFVDCNYTSGSEFFVGTTRVCYEAVDEQDNKATCDFYVTVIDGTPPVITGCPKNDSKSLDPDSNSTTFSWVEPTASDNDGILSFISSHNTSDLFYSGDTVVSYVATDNSFNTATCTFTLTGQDIEAPTVTCPSDVPSMNVVPGTASSKVKWSAPPSANDTVDGDVTANVVCTDDMGNVVVSGGLYAVGLTTVTCRANDTALNEGSCEFNITVVDNEAPSVTCPSDVPSINVDPGTTSSNVTWSAPPSANDIVDGDVTANVVCTDDTGNVVVSGDLYALGLTTVTCRANDTALNEGSCQFNITVVDNEAPSVTCPSDVPSMNVDPGTASSNVTWSAPPSANDIVDGDVTANVVCKDDLGNVVESGDLYAVGLTTVTCRANDTALNEGSCQFNITVVDNEAPTVTCPIVVPSMNVDPGTASSNVTWSTPPTANDIVDGDVTANVVCTDDMGNVVVSGDLYAVGVTTVTCRANDTALNEGSCLLNITVDDNEAPSVTCPSDVPSINVDPGTTSSNVTWSAPPSADDIVDGDVTANVVCTDDMGNVVESGDLYAVGLTTVTCTANDTALNEGSCLFNITVVDNEAPSVTCPSDVPSMNVDPGTASSNVTWSAPPSANDIVDGDVTANVVCKDDLGNVVESGDLYAVGLTTVTCRANDTALNEGSCQFNITVVDNEAPTVTCPIVVPSMNVDPGTASSNVTWSTPPTANDIVDGDVTANVVCTDDMGNVVVSGDLYAVGVTTVTCRANDTALNEGSCLLNITVDDNEAPSVTCPSDVPSINVDPGTTSSNVTWSAPPSANDIVDGDVTANVVCTDDMGNVVESGDLYAVGLTTVTCTANDTALNEGSCLFNITVVDDEAPTLTCPSDVPSMNVDPGTASSNVTCQCCVYR